jgi:predicted ATPase
VEAVLTRLRVQGFKNLLDVEVHFGPFTCIAGANGVGKSNLFDAIHFLHLLTELQVMEAVQKIRQTSGKPADPRSLFTAFGTYRAPEMRFSADLIVGRHVQDDFGVKAEASTSALRYEVAFALDERDGMPRLKLTHESLEPVAVMTARKHLGFPASKAFLSSSVVGRRTRPFISTEAAVGNPEITVHQEGHGGRKLPATNSSRTVIGGLATSEFPTILALNREMASWRTLLLEPSAMRAPSLYRDPRMIDSRGGNLPATIYRLERNEDRKGRVRTAIVNQLSRLLEDARELHLRPDDGTETWTVELRGRDGIFHPARSLSDGTLRFLVLTVLGLDPEARGIICLEEPENGIHPQRIKAMVELLRGIAVDADLPIDESNPLRQVVVNTHSPLCVRHIRQDELVYLDDESVVRSGAAGRVAAVRVPPNSWRARLDNAPVPVAPGDLIDYLGNAADGWRAMDYGERHNGEPVEVHLGVGRAD